MSRAAKMYAETPTLKRGEDGKMGVTRAEKESARSTDGTEGMMIHEDGMPAHARHAAERRDLYNRHETEHSVRDGGKSDKKDMHKRHAKELMDMHKRHESEGASASSKGAPEESMKTK